VPERLVVVSNRLPVTMRRSAGRWIAELSGGGLVAALGPVVEREGGLWIGWPGAAQGGTDDDRADILRAWERDHAMASVDLPAAISRAFYEGYSNTTLWPLLHGFPSHVSFDPGTFAAYRDANERFADAVVDRLQPDDLVWVQDYQLMLLPALLRERRPEARIAFFLHVPFPAADTFRILPQRETLLRGLLGADVIAFQTHEHLGAFRRTLLAVLGVESRLDRLEIDGRPVVLAARPIGIEPDAWHHLVTADRRVVARINELRARHAGRHLVIAVDRLDYTKGIPERLRALGHLFRTRPEWRNRITLVQVAVPSREGVPRYAALRREVNELVGELNGELGTADWTPVIYLRRSVPRSEVAALYAAADVAWVGSLRDGMNLVAKEYIACQGDGAGVLLLSEFAGAAGELGEAIRVNPYDGPGSADALVRALEMPVEERRDRQAALLRRVHQTTALAWARRSVADLRQAADERVRNPGTSSAPRVDDLRRRFADAAVRNCYLDYDGTLVPLAPRPSDAVPGPGVVEVVEALAAGAGTTVAVLSGRSRADLERWFGRLDRVWLAAEHGALVRAPGSTDWLPLHQGSDTSWMADIRPILEGFAERVPGSMIEDKELALAWHFRLAEPESGEWFANELATTLEDRVAGTDLSILRGSKVVEVRFAWANKGDVAAYIRAAGVPPDLELAVGDDRTDEDLFARLSEDALTIRVGAGPTRARHRVTGPGAVVALLAALAEAVPSAG
jgi:trehalose 6-phosphate synthase/phosphatase